MIAIARPRPFPAARIAILATVAMLFTAFVASYLVRRTSADWKPVQLPPLLWAGWAVLVGSSTFVEVGRRTALWGQFVRARRALVAGSILGVLFLSLQGWAWSELIRQGVFLPSSPHASFFYTLSALHAVHLAAGLVALAVALRQLLRRGEELLVSGAATFWHTLGLIWTILLVMLWTL